VHHHGNLKAHSRNIWISVALVEVFCDVTPLFWECSGSSLTQTVVAFQFSIRNYPFIWIDRKFTFWSIENHTTQLNHKKGQILLNRCVERSAVYLSCEQLFVAGCKAVFRTVYKLEEHARRHTQEKRVGCPTCGSLFANKVKFLDHCQRQIPVECEFWTCWHASLT
jgi:hypothetical protein